MGTKNFLILFDALSKTNWEELTENQLLNIYKKGLNLKGAKTSSRSRFVVMIGIFAYNKRETRIKVRSQPFPQKHVNSAKLPY